MAAPGSSLPQAKEQCDAIQVLHTWDRRFILHCPLWDALNQTADKKLFEVKRKDQMNALKNLIELNDVNQQYKIIDIMLKGLFKVSFT